MTALLFFDTILIVIGDKPLGFAYGYILPMPEYVTPVVWVYALEVLKGTQKKGVGTNLVAQLRTYCFYENPFSNIFFLCFKDNRGLYETIKRSNGCPMDTLVPFFIPNENVDENGTWKGTPPDGNISIHFDS